jgi:MOSC domain-containing protein YiiM
MVLDENSTLESLRARFPHHGRLEWIGVRPARQSPMRTADATPLSPKYGLTEDYRSRGNRQVTLIQAEHLPVIAALCGLDSVEPGMLRRNLVVSGISLRALKDKRFSIGPVQLLGTGECVPCSHMEQNLGIGGYNAMRGHGGITARVLSEGHIRIGDTVKAVVDEPA